MKKILFLLMMSVAAFAAAVDECKYQAEWLEPLAARKSGLQELVPADADVDAKKLRRTAFYVDFNEYGIMFTVLLNENDAKARNEVEIFFAPEGCTSYYQFYGFPFERGWACCLHPRPFDTRIRTYQDVRSCC